MSDPGSPIRFRKKQSAMDMFKIIKQACKGTRDSNKKLQLNVEIHTDPVTFLNSSACLFSHAEDKAKTSSHIFCLPTCSI